MHDEELAHRVVQRYLMAFKYGPKETKQHRVEKLTDTIRDATGLGRGTAEAIADAIVRGRDWLALRIQKDWPIDDAGKLEGPKGNLNLKELAMAKTAAKVSGPLQNKCYKALLDAYTDPEKERDLEDRENGAKEIDEELGKMLPGLDFGEDKVGDYSSTIYDMAEELPELVTKIDWELKKVFTPLIEDAAQKLKAAEAALSELGSAFEAAKAAIDHRQNEMYDIQNDVEQERQRRQDAADDRAYDAEQRAIQKRRQQAW